MRTNAVLGTLGALVFGALGCGGDRGVAPPPTASAFCEKAEALSTARMIQCYGGSAADWTLHFFGASTCPMLDKAVAEHRLSYASSKAAACLDKLSQPYTCVGKWPEELCVYSVLAGAVVDGQPCDTTYVCAADSFCGAPFDVSDFCPVSVCQHIAALGEKCDSSFCNSGTTCVEGVCVANGKAGAPCGRDLAYCGDNLVCAYSDPTPTCKPTTEGGPCVDASDCLDHLYCDSTRHCHARLGLGAACSVEDYSCQTFTACDPVTGRCVEASQVGQLCGNIYGTPQLCEEGLCLTVDDAVGRCVIPIDDGAPCTMSYECSSDFCDANGICAQPPSNDGADCSDPNFVCTSGICTSGICTAKEANGAACTFHEECKSGSCRAGTCQDTGANGASCTGDGRQCASGHCVGNTCAACP